MKIIKGYKFIQKDMKSKKGNHKWIVGKWYKLDENKINLCKYGFHACLKPREALDFIYGDKFFIVEARGKIIHEKNRKFVASEMRLVKELPASQIFKRFAIWSAKQCVKNYEKEYPNDSRVSDCIKVSEDYLDGKISLNKLSAAESAANLVAESAANLVESVLWSAAESAANSAANSAASSVESAASSAANSAAESAARSAAWSARSAARSAWSAAESAESVLWSIANSAANSAAESAESAADKFLKSAIKQYTITTSEDIKSLKNNQIFVFGSNKAGKHNGGAAKLAKEKFKAESGRSEGLTGKCYAFPTLDKDFNKLDLKEIKKSVNKLNKCARENPYKIFLLTKVGCGIAGYSEKVIKKLFKKTELNIIKPKGW